MVWVGARRATELDEPAPDAAAETFAGYPVLAVPVATALTIALHHLLTGGEFDRASIVLGLVAVAHGGGPGDVGRVRRVPVRPTGRPSRRPSSAAWSPAPAM